MAGRLAVAQHQERARRHVTVGSALDDAGDEWAAVPYFYSAYHHVKAALIADPVWDDVSRLHALHADLIPDDRFIGRHHGRRGMVGPRQWGINELVLLLYKPIAGDYERLHQASNDVRYSTGLPTGALPALRPCLDRISAAADAGQLVAP